MKKNNNLSTMEWDTLWMAIRYAVHRDSIHCATFPGDIIKWYYKRLTPEQKKIIVSEIERAEKYNDLYSDKPFEEREEWVKLWRALDEKAHIVITWMGKKMKIFLYKDYIVPIDEYLKNPGVITYILKRGQKVKYKGKGYEFGYIGANGHAIIYKKGCRNMQDSLAVDFKELV